MDRYPYIYSEEIVRECYASYAAILPDSTSRNAKTTSQTTIIDTLVCWFSVYIFESTIHRFVYDPRPRHTWELIRDDFHYRWYIVRSEALQLSVEKRETVL